TGQRRGGVGDVGPDRRTARLRDEFEGGERGRSDAAVHLRHVPLRRLTMTIRAILLSTALAVFCFGAAGAQDFDDFPAAPVLRSQVIVSGDVVRVGDLVDNA